MTGAGVFLGPAPAARAAGAWFLLGIPVAAIAVSLCVSGLIGHDSDGPAYLGIRFGLGVTAARMSSSLYLAGHIAAMAAVARAIAQYLLPSAARGFAAMVILVAVLVSTMGMRIRGRSGWYWLALSVVVLGLTVALCLAIAPAPVATPLPHSVLGVTSAAATMFFGFLGFERLAATGGRARSAVWRDAVIAVVLMTLLMTITGAALLYQLGPARLGLSPAPITDALGAAAAGEVTPLLGGGIALAMVPALLAALESFRDTAVAVVDASDLPRLLGRTGRTGTPYLLDLSAGVVAAVLAQVLAPTQAINLAACCVLVHYAFVNIAAQQSSDDGKWQTWARCLGMVLAVVLAMSMPVPIMLSTLVVVVAGPLLMGAFSRQRP